MLFRLFKSYGLWLLITTLVCLIGTTVGALSQPSQGKEFFDSFAYHWNGIVVSTTGFGALTFAISTYKQQFNYLIYAILKMDEEQAVSVYASMERLYSPWNKQIIAMPVLVLGALTLYICGYPLYGLPKIILWISSSFMFYAGGLMLAYAVYAVRVFYYLEQNAERIHIQDNVNIFELENFNLYLSVLLLTAMVALYFAFRGTLTANFSFIPPNSLIASAAELFLPPGQPYRYVRNLLIFPIIAFLPFTLFSGFYMRMTLRKIYLGSIKQKVLEIDELARPIAENVDQSYPAERVIEIRKAAIELKEKIIENSKVLPLFDTKDSPSIILFAIIVLQYIFNNDGAVKSFFSQIISLNMKQ